MRSRRSQNTFWKRNARFMSVWGVHFGRRRGCGSTPVLPLGARRSLRADIGYTGWRAGRQTVPLCRLGPFWRQNVFWNRDDRAPPPPPLPPRAPNRAREGPRCPGNPGEADTGPVAAGPEPAFRTPRTTRGPLARRKGRFQCDRVADPPRGIAAPSPPHPVCPECPAPGFPIVRSTRPGVTSVRFRPLPRAQCALFCALDARQPAPCPGCPECGARSPRHGRG